MCCDAVLSPSVREYFRVFRWIVWENVSVCLPPGRNGTGCWEAIWLMGSVGTTRFRVRTRQEGNDSPRQNPTEHIKFVESVGNIGGKWVRNTDGDTIALPSFLRHRRVQMYIHIVSHYDFFFSPTHTLMNICLVSI